jgi:superoxide dismutase, Fe-Mn family
MGGFASGKLFLVHQSNKIIVQTMKRNYLLTKVSMVFAASALLIVVTAFTNKNENNMRSQETLQAFEFPVLPYNYNALEPYIDAQTMEIHYDRHHRAYFNNFLTAIKGTPAEKLSLEQIFAEMSTYSDAIRNNGGGYFNHMLFWNNLSANGGKPSSALAADIDATFGSFDKFKEQFGNAGKTRFGSGWAWLVVTDDGKLAIGSTPNQDNPLMDKSPIKGTPILCLDVWEHAYYLKYQNKRPEYVEAFWNVVNWNDVSSRYAEAKRQ